MILVLSIRRSQTIEGLNLSSQILLLISNVCRVFWFKDTNMYDLPIVFLEVSLSLSIQSYIVILFRKYKETQIENVQPFYFRIYALVIFSIIFAFLFNHGQGYFTLQFLIAFSFYIESLSMLPQINMIRKMGTVQKFIGKYLTFMAFSRLARILFWLYYYLEGQVYLTLLLADIIHTAILADFVWIYLKNTSKSNIIII